VPSEAVDGGCVLAAAVESEDALGDGIVDDGVGIGVGLCGAESFEGFDIEDDGGVGAAGAYEAAAEVGSEGNAVNALRVGDIAFDGVGVSVHDDDVGAMRNVDAACSGVDGDVVPAFIARDGDSFDDVITGSTWSGRGGARFEAGAED